MTEQSGIFSLQFRELNRTVAGILIFREFSVFHFESSIARWREFSVFVAAFCRLSRCLQRSRNGGGRGGFDTGTVAGTLTSKLRDVRLSVSTWCMVAGFAGTSAARGRDQFNFDTGTVAGIVSLQFRELNRTGAGILIFH